eukprot:CAMPEP_0197485552 /NCGR_PEP_ID=MMETSP1311-20131121/479_1 /TAXON_ID=464262 /ORGANISM="Genus nov. species nov., Strain RCC856" /LENGTH=73 /DNA_ID=CAMNT_0043028245 /DNA_START=61 /DNA_END=280 /DNA_ORIENTATION=+
MVQSACHGHPFALAHCSTSKWPVLLDTRESIRPMGTRSPSPTSEPPDDLPVQRRGSTTGSTGIRSPSPTSASP